MTVGDLVTLKRGKTYKSRLLGESGPVLLGLSTIQRNGGFRSDSIKTYGGDSPEDLLLRPGDVYVSLKDVTQSADLLGAVARVPDSIESGRLTQDTVKLNPKSPGTPMQYLYWVLRSPQYREYCRARATGTTNLGLDREDFLSYAVPKLTRSRQAVVEMLEHIESKIELNRRMNETLESMARALYKSWFVDFDPVVAKAAGKRPFGMDDATAAFFPDRFVDSELGPIPEGWSIQPLREIADVNWGDTSITKKSYTDTGYIAFSAIGPDGRLPYFDYDCDGVVLSAIGANCGVTWFAKGKWSCIKNTIRILPIVSGPPAEYLYYTTRSPAVWPIRGSAQPFISQGDARGIPVIVPDMATIVAFTSMSRDWIALAHQNDCESQTLAQLRDLLLPKLISGEIRVKDAEKVVGEAV